MSFIPSGVHNGMGLQATIAAATSQSYPGMEPVLPHHPFTCVTGPLYYDEEGQLSCTHAKAPLGDPRTQAGLNHSIAVLIVELASKL